MKKQNKLFICVALLLSATVLWAAPKGAEKKVNKVLDQLHIAASKGDGPTYFSLYSSRAVYFGTDASERWPIKDFIKYTKKRFAEGSAWTYKPVERNVYFSDDGKTAWFDERLSHEIGEARGTGVLILEKDGWKIVQYNLSFPVPNDVFYEVYDIVGKYNKSHK